MYLEATPRPDAVVEEGDFLCGLVGSTEKERTDMKLEIWT